MLQLIRDNRLGEAVKLGRSRLKENPEDYDSRYALGVAHLVSGNLNEACEHLSQVFEKRPIDYKCAANLGVVQLRLKNYDKAISTLQYALSLNPSYVEAEYNLACAFLASKKTAPALEHFTALRNSHPNNLNYQCAIADTHRESGRWVKAINAYRRILPQDQNYFRAHLNLGALLLHLGKVEQARNHCETAVELCPTEIKAHKNLGDCLVQLELLDDAMESYANAYDLNPESSDLCVAIGKVWQEIGKSQEALSWFDKATIHDKNNIEAICSQGSILCDSSNIDEAIELLEPLLKTNPDNIELNITLSDIYWEDGAAEAAMTCLEHVRKLQPSRLHVLTKLASILNSSGNTQRAIDLYHEALKQNSKFIPALTGLATSQKGELESKQVALMERILKQETTHSGQASGIHSGLAFYYDAQKSCETSIEKAVYHMNHANKLQWEYRSKRDWDYDTGYQESFINNLIETFSTRYFEQYGHLGHSSVVPIFIVGMPRSGTTLTEQILSRHSKILGVGERQFAAQSFHSLSQGKETSNLNQYLSKLTKENVTIIAEQYLSRLNNLIAKSEKQGVTHVVDKMPDNYALIGWVLTLFPNAKIIHADRDPRDIALSCWLTQFRSIPWACKTEHLSHRIKHYQRIMSHWNSTLKTEIHHSNYEDLVANQERCSRNLIAFIGLEWDKKCLSFYKSNRLVRTASITQVREPIYKKSVAKWVHYQAHLEALFQNV